MELDVPVINPASGCEALLAKWYEVTCELPVLDANERRVRVACCKL